MISSVRIVGAGLIGTSIALALKSAGVSVQIIDTDKDAALLSGDLVKSIDIQAPDLIVIAVPISENEKTVVEQLNSNPSSIVCDLASVKSDLLVKVKALSANATNFISLHPMAGREVSGAANARADLFSGRPWIIINDVGPSEKAKIVARELIDICKANAYQMSSSDHDLTVAKLSHLPQILSSALADSLNSMSEQSVKVAGQGIKDVTRLAQSDFKLWSEILLANKLALSPILSDFISNLQTVLEDLENSNAKNISSFLRDGQLGKEKISGKHGAQNRNYAFLPIVIDDKPGQLARIFNECAKNEVNIEDLSIEHSPGQETGLVTLAIAPGDHEKLAKGLENLGFKIHPTKYR